MVQIEAAGHDVAAFGIRLDVEARLVLVADFANDLFHHVFHRHQSRRAAILIHDRGHVIAVLLHLPQQIVTGLVSGTKPDGPHQIAYTVLTRVPCGRVRTYRAHG